MVDLIQRARRGDLDALEHLLRRCSVRLRELAHSRMGPHLRPYLDVDDVVQQATTEAFRCIAMLDLEGDPEKRFHAWLEIVLNNVIAAQARKHKRQVDRLATQVMQERPVSGPSPSRVQREEERRDRLRAAIVQLPHEYRIVMELHLKGLGQTQIADQLNTTKAAVNARQARARQVLRDALGSPSLNLPSS